MRRFLAAISTVITAGLTITGTVQAQAPRPSSEGPFPEGTIVHRVDTLKVEKGPDGRCVWRSLTLPDTPVRTTARTTATLGPYNNRDCTVLHYVLTVTNTGETRAGTPRERPDTALAKPDSNRVVRYPQALTKADTSMMRRHAAALGIDTTKATIRVRGETARIEWRKDPSTSNVIGVEFHRLNGKWAAMWGYEEGSVIPPAPPPAPPLRDPLVKPAVIYTYPQQRFEIDSSPPQLSDSAAVVEVIRKNFAGQPHTIRRVRVFGDSAQVVAQMRNQSGEIRYMLDKKDGLWVKRPEELFVHYNFGHARPAPKDTVRKP